MLLSFCFYYFDKFVFVYVFFFQLYLQFKSLCTSFERGDPTSPVSHLGERRRWRTKGVARASHRGSKQKPPANQRNRTGDKSTTIPVKRKKNGYLTLKQRKNIQPPEEAGQAEAIKKGGPTSGNARDKKGKTVSIPSFCERAFLAQKRRYFRTAL